MKSACVLSINTGLEANNCVVKNGCLYFLCQLNDCLNSRGETFVLLLNNLLNDCGCSKPVWLLHNMFLV